MVWYGIVGRNVPLDTIYVISGTILRVVWPNQQCHSSQPGQGPIPPDLADQNGKECNKKNFKYT